MANILVLRERLDQSGVGLSGDACADRCRECLVDSVSFRQHAQASGRVSKSQASAGLPQGICSPSFSTVAGLLAIAAAGGEEATAYRDREALGAGYFGRVGQWLKTGFA
jgi:cell division protein FtsA